MSEHFPKHRGWTVGGGGGGGGGVGTDRPILNNLRHAHFLYFWESKRERAILFATARSV